MMFLKLSYETLTNILSFILGAIGGIILISMIALNKINKGGK